MENSTSPGLPSSPTPDVAKSLGRHLWRRSPVPVTEYVTVPRLAEELGVDPERIRPLLERGYLRVMSKSDTYESIVVARPPLAAMRWLKTMFAPIEMRPLVPVKDIARSMEISDVEFRSICLHDGLPIYDDPVFGELMSIDTVDRLYRSWHDLKTTSRVDRESILLLLSLLKGVKDRRKLRPMTYSKRLDREISRIANMPEPARTLRAAEFWKAYNDADKVTDCLEKGPVKKRQWRIRNRIEDHVKSLKDKVIHQTKRKNVPDENRLGE